MARLVIASAALAALLLGEAALGANTPKTAGPTSPTPAPSNAPGLREVEAGQRRRETDRDAAEAGAAAARLEVAQLQAQLNELDAARKAGQRSVSGKRLRLAALNVRESELDAELGAAQSKLARLLGALELFRRDPPPALFVDPRDVRDAVRAVILIRAVAPELERQAAVLKIKAEALRRLKRAVDTASEELFTSESDVADRTAKIEALIAAKSALEERDAADATAAGQDVEALAARAKALRDLSRGLAAAEPPPADAEPPNPESAGLFGRPKMFTPPAPGSPIRRFGEPEAGGAARSQGWTWRIGGPTEIVSPAKGVVEYAGPLKAWDVVLILRLGGGYHLVLAGLEATTVTPGQMVNEGQAVGRMAAAGAQPMELYLEVRKNDAAVDPARWLTAPPSPSAARR